MRELAETWAAMRFEPRLLGGLEGDRRTRVLDRLRDALATERCPPAARRLALGIRGALAIVERRWAEARDALEFLSADSGAGRERALRLSDRGRRHRDERAIATPRPRSVSTRAPARRAPATRG